MKRHRWMVVMPYEVTDQDALRFAGLLPFDGSDQPPSMIAADEAPAPTDQRPFLGLHNVRRDLVAVACWDCETALTDARIIDRECAGQPAGELAYVDATGRQTAEDAARPQARRDVGQLGAQQALRSVSRNDPCPCGSGRKWKRCHGA